MQSYAHALGVHEDYLQMLVEAAAGEIPAASACMIRKNAEKFIGVMHPDHPMATEVLPVLFSWHLGSRSTRSRAA